jgi:twitching motility protein PilT
MQTFDQHLKELVASGDVSYEVAHAAASNPSDFDLQMRTLGGMSKAAAVTVAAPGPPIDVFAGGLDFLNS